MSWTGSDEESTWTCETWTGNEGHRMDNNSIPVLVLHAQSPIPVPH